jgi:hypothetical protein
MLTSGKHYGWSGVATKDLRLLLAVARAADKANNAPPIGFGDALADLYDALDRLNAKPKERK